MATSFIYIDEDTLIEFDEAKDSSDDSYINDGTATFSVKTDNDGSPGTEVASGSMSYVADSDGKYQGTLDKDDPDPALGVGTYWLEMTFTSGTKNGFRRMTVSAKYHGSIT